MTIKNERLHNMEDLADFVYTTAQKRTYYLNRRCRDFRIEAVLEATLKRTQNELDCHHKSKKRKHLLVNEDWLEKNGLKRSKPDEYEWGPGENGHWGLSRQAEVEDLFNLTEFFNDLKEVCQRIPTSS